MNNPLPKIKTSTINVHKCIHLLGGLRAGTGRDGQLIISLLTNQASNQFLSPSLTLIYDKTVERAG